MNLQGFDLCPAVPPLLDTHEAGVPAAPMPFDVSSIHGFADMMEEYKL